jgi:hypothetical protein
MDEKDVIATQALTYDANEAVEIGLVDRIGSLEDEMAIFSDEVAETEDETMANDNNTDKGIDKATHDAAVAQATAAGASAEKTRIKAILACDEGKNRPKAAFSCALNSGMSLEEAKTFMADLPEEKPEAKVEEKTTPQAKKTPFEESMDASGNPQVGTMSKKEGGDKDEDDADSILATYAMATGKKRKTA